MSPAAPTPPLPPTDPAAVLWDMDGTIVDTEPYWMESETPLVERFGGTWTHDQALRLVGLGLWDAAALLQGAGVALSADEIVDELTDSVTRMLGERGVPFRPGARELLAAFADRGTPQALVTMSVRRMALEVARLIGFSPFAAVVGGDDVERPKPFADPYLLGARLLGVEASRCVAIEDSPTGVRAAVAAGCFTIGVPHFVDLDGMGAHAIVGSLAELTPERVGELFAAHAASASGSDTAGGETR